MTPTTLAEAILRDVPDLSDPVTVHVNMLRGTIAKPTVEQIVHLYGREAFQPMIDVAIAKALEKACLAVSEHADWPEDEHGRTEQVGLFARVINAIRAITPALSSAPTDAAHVNETPKSQHDAGNVLTDAALIARLREIQGQAGLFASAAADLITALLVQNAALRAERDWWKRDSAAAWDKCEERRIAQEAAEAERDALEKHIEDTAKDTHKLLVAAEAKVKKLRAERDELSSKLEVERALTDAVHRLAKAAEAQIAALTARVERLTGALRRIRNLPDEIEEQVKVTRAYAADSGMDRNQIVCMEICTSHFLDHARTLRAALSTTDATTEKGGDAHAVDPRHAPHEASPGVTAGAEAPDVLRRMVADWGNA